MWGSTRHVVTMLIAVWSPPRPAPRPSCSWVPFLGRDLRPRSPRPPPRAAYATRCYSSSTDPSGEYILSPPVAALYPELLTPGSSSILIGIDPDISGALAVLSWHNREGEGMPWEHAELSVHDMPVMLWQLASRVKKQPCSTSLLDILRPYASQQQQGGGGGGDRRSLVVRAVLEVTAPGHMSGKHAWFNIGYSTGMLDALLTALDIPYTRIHAAIWKRQMGLFKKGKPGSMALAHQVLPAAAPFLKRKKDHGRAEALLIAAWGLGCRAEAVAMEEEGPEDAPLDAEEEGAEDEAAMLPGG